MNFDKIVITEINSVSSVFYHKGRRGTVTNRQHFGLLFSMEGQLTYTIDDITFKTERNHAVILPKGKSYTIRGDASGIFPIIEFECENLSADGFISLPVRNTENATRDFEKLKNLTFKGDNLMAMSLFYSMLHDLSPAEDSHSKLLTPAINYIENNYSDYGITNKELAAKCRISEVYLRKLFLKTFGVSPKQYIIDIRIRKAKQLLTEEVFKISTIAEQCGFSNQYHFCRLFKQKCGMTPSEFVNKNKTYEI